MRGRMTLPSFAFHVAPSTGAAVIALITFIALALGEVPGFKLNRATIAMIGAGAVLVFGVLTLPEAERTIDLGTLILLLSMMIINAVLELSGFFTWVGEVVIERANAPATLLALVVVTSGVLSMLFLNDPVCVMLTPLVCGVVLRLKRNPMPYLIALACSANVGSVATITGNPQNILIGASSGIGYLYWLARLGPVAAVGMAIVFAVIWLLYPREFRGGRYAERISEAPAMIAPHHEGAPITLAQAETTIYASTLRKSLIVIALMLVAFLAGINVTVAAFIAACAILISRRFESARILALVDWPLLVMFGGLFIVTGALEVTGVSEQLFELVRPLAFAGTAPLALVTTILSNLISNVPAVLLFRPLVPQFADPTQAWLTLAAASTLAGNLTLIGSVANLIVAEQALKFGIKLTFMEYLKPGLIITMLTLVAAIVFLG
ncbi:MAG: anion transporter [Candidatus Roseilinea sp.]|nr:MAG: anion transporter [Candidatus Roseilinea sp.]